MRQPITKCRYILRIINNYILSELFFNNEVIEMEKNWRWILELLNKILKY